VAGRDLDEGDTKRETLIFKLRNIFSPRDYKHAGNPPGVSIRPQ
jgi:hypothetical protein